MGGEKRLQGRDAGLSARGASRHQERDSEYRGRERLRLPQGRGRRPPSGAYLPVRRQQAAAHLLRLRLRLSGDRGRRGGEHRGERPEGRHLPLGRGRRPERQQGDRKSTRLNSSHGYISYAVFCLKKKTKKQ